MTDEQPRQVMPRWVGSGRPVAALLCLGWLVVVQACAASEEPADRVGLRQEVLDTERSFAHTMAAREHTRFVSFLAEEAVFLSGEDTLRGKQQVADGWKAYFEAPDAPFSWEPEQVEVLDSGTLALSTGPVHDPDGTRIATFTSIWRREAPGQWRIVFDRGSPASPGP